MPDWSVVIPAYNEAARLPVTLQRVAHYIETQRPGGEIIVVDDGSRDATVSALETLQHQLSVPIKLIQLPANQGKGAAVRIGMMAARGAWVLFMDADGSVAIEEVDRMLPHLELVPIVIGSKYLDPSPDTAQQGLARTLIAKGGNLLVRILFGLTYADTQCGFKLLTREAARDLFGQMSIDRWAFDIELLALARRLGYHVREIPLNWQNTDDSRVSVIPAARTTLLELLRIRWNLWTGHYRQARRRARTSHKARRS